MKLTVKEDLGVQMKKFDKNSVKENKPTDESGVFEPSFNLGEDFWISVAKSWTSYRIRSKPTITYDPLSVLDNIEENEKV